MEPLLIVDVQNAFINEYTHHIPTRIREIATGESFAPRYATRFINGVDGPYVRLLGWNDALEEPGIDLVPELAGLVSESCMYDKHGITGLPGTLKDQLRADGVERLAIAGIDTDMCVMKTALDVFDLGIEPIVLTDCCASTAGLQAHLAALAVLARNIGANRLWHLGNGGVSLGAPST